MPGPVVVGSALSEETKKEGRKEERRKEGKTKRNRIGRGTKESRPRWSSNSSTRSATGKGISYSKAIAPSRNQPLFCVQSFRTTYGCLTLIGCKFPSVLGILLHFESGLRSSHMTPKFLRRAVRDHVHMTSALS